MAEAGQWGKPWPKQGSWAPVVVSDEDRVRERSRVTFSAPLSNLQRDACRQHQRGCPKHHQGSLSSAPSFCWKVSLLSGHLCWAVLSHSVMSDSLRPRGLQPSRPLRPWGFSRQENWGELSCPLPGHLSQQAKNLVCRFWSPLSMTLRITGERSFPFWLAAGGHVPLPGPIAED